MKKDVAEIKKLLESEKKDTADIKKKMDAVNKKIQDLSVAMYQKVAEEQAKSKGAGAGPDMEAGPDMSGAEGPSEPSDDNVVDAEFTEKEAPKKKKK